MSNPAQAVEASSAGGASGTDKSSSIDEASSAEEETPSSLDEGTVERIIQGALI